MSQQTPTQTLVFGAGNCVAWLDPSTASSLTHPVTPDHVTSLTDLAAGLVLTYGSQATPTSSTSASPTLDSTTLPQPALALGNGFIWTTPVVMADHQGQFALFYVGGYNAHTTTERDTWLVASQPANLVADFQPSAIPVTTTGGGVLLTRVGGTTNHFQLSFYDGTGHHVQSSVFVVPNDAFLLSIQVVENISGFPTITVRLNGAPLWSYDAGTLNPDGLNFANQQFTSFGTGPSMAGIEATGEILVYSGVVANTSVAPVENYLTTKWVPTLSALSFGSLNTTAGIVGQAFTSTIAIDNATTVGISTIAANMGSTWAATAPTDGSNVWTITGLLPASNTNFLLVLTATDATGSQTLTQAFPIEMTLTGTPSTLQQLVQAHNPVLWLDPSASTNVTLVNNRVTYVRDRVTGAGFIPTSSETPTLDATALKRSGLAFASPSESASGFNYGLALDPTSRPDAFGNVTTAFTAGGVTANLPMGNGLVVTAADGSYTLVMVAATTGQAGGAANADLTVKNDFPPTALNYCEAQWGILTPTLGSSPATVWASDAVTDAVVLNTGLAATPNRYEGNLTLALNEPAVVVWRFDPVNGPSLRINGSTVGLNWTHGSAGAWQSPLQRLTQIAGTHSLGTVGELIAFPQALSDADLSAIEAQLISLWFPTVGTAPTISALSSTSQYATYVYTGQVTIDNGGLNPITAGITASAGTGWRITQDAVTPTLWHIAGYLPATGSVVTLAITAEQDNATTTVNRSITIEALPTAPTIEALSPLIGVVSAAYVGTLTVLNVHRNDSSLGLSVSSSHGSGWTIIADPSLTPDLYQISGTLPATVQNFTLTVTANDQSLDNLANVVARRTFTLETTGSGVVQTTPYQLDLTGLLPANKITNEPQVLTPDNGPNNQFFLPVKGPFFGSSLVLQYKPTTHLDWQTAQPGSDYLPVGEFQALSAAAVSPVFMAVSVMNTAINGDIRITYQTLGGNFVFDRQGLLTQLADMLINQRQIDWSQVVNLPMFFPVGIHTHNADTDLIGLSGLTAKLNLITANINSNGQAQDVNDMMAHMANQSNPHQVHPVDVDLGLVPNYPTATALQAVDQTNTSTLLTPFSAALAAAGAVGQASATQAGMVRLNEGNTAGDDNNAADGITAAGILALMTAAGSNAIKTNFASGEQAVQVSPYPMTFPLYWQGNQYQNLTDFIAAVETYVEIEPLPFNQITGVMYFPKNITAPALVTSPTSTALGTRDFTTEDSMSLPLLVPTGATW